MTTAPKRTKAEARAEKKRKIAQAIGRGAELIRKRGWCIGSLRDDSGRLCLMGAIKEAAKHETREIRYSAYDEVNKVLRRQNSSIHTWSDEQTSGEKVADLLEVVAKNVDPTYRMERICIHAEPLCPDCGAAPSCFVGDGWGGFACSSGFSDFGHRPTCPQPPIIRQQIWEEKKKKEAALA